MYFYDSKNWKQISEENRTRSPVARTLNKIRPLSPAVLNHRENPSSPRAPGGCSWGCEPCGGQGAEAAPLGRAWLGPTELSCSCCCCCCEGGGGEGEIQNVWRDGNTTVSLSSLQYSQKLLWGEERHHLKVGLACLYALQASTESGNKMIMTKHLKQCKLLPGSQ